MLQMARTTKRLDIRFGSFACSVQGFDDPVMPVQQVLRAIQHLLEETPELSDSGISFDAEAVESLIEEVARRAELASEDIEITPGLVIVHRGENDAPARRLRETAAGDDTADDGEGETNGEAWARPPTAGGKPAKEETASGSGRPAYVNIFAARSAGATKPGGSGDERSARKARVAPKDTGAEASSDADPVAQDRLRDIFAETIGDPDGSLFTERLAAEENDGGPLNLFSRSGSRAEEPDETGEPIFGAFELRGEPESGDMEANPGYADDPADQDGSGDAAPVSDEASSEYTVAGLVQAAGATTIPDMMICAAAWMVLLQGKVSFTRREVLDVFDQIPGDHEKTLEARIKGFGKATRNGQLVAVEDGTFGLSQEELDRFERLL